MPVVGAISRHMATDVHPRACQIPAKGAIVNLDFACLREDRSLLCFVVVGKIAIREGSEPFSLQPRIVLHRSPEATIHKSNIASRPTSK